MKRFKPFFGLGILLVLSGAATVLSPTFAQGDVPKLINFQGILKDGSGNPVANDSYSATFRIYDAATAGNELWMETQSVTTTNGLFTVLLGASIPVPDSVFEDTLRWLGITVAPDLVEMAPRQQLVSVGYSFAFAGWTISDSNLILAERLGGSIGIGTSTPTEKLDVEGNIIADTIKADAFSSASPLRLQTSGTTRIYVDDLTGRVGIGTETPARMLELATGDLRLSGPTAEIGYSNSADLAARPLDPAPPNPITVPPNPCFRLFSGVSHDLLFAINNSGDLFTGGALKSGNSITIDGINDKISAAGGTIGFENNDLVSIGQIGIGTAGPVAPLTIQPVAGNEIEFPSATTVDIVANNHFNVGTANATSNLNLLTNNASRVTVSGANGNVGIGTTNPSDVLHISGSSSGRYIQNQNLLAGAPFGFRLQSPDRQWFLAQSLVGTPAGSFSIYDGTAGATRLHIGNTGSVGLGTASPAAGYGLHIRSSTDSIIRAESNTGTTLDIRTSGGRGILSSSGDLALFASGSEKVRISTTGEVGIGTPLPTTSLHVSDTESRLRLQSSLATSFTVTEYQTNTREWHSGVGGSAAGGGVANNYYVWYGNGVNQFRLVIDTVGFVGIGTTSPLDALQVVGNIRVGTTGTNGCLKRFDGVSLVGTCASDLRLKKDIKPFSPLLDKLAQLQPVTFNWRTDEYPDLKLPKVQDRGLIAQEVEKILPELVIKEESGFKAIHYHELPLMLLQVVKELKAENDELKGRILKLEQDRPQAEVE